MLPEEKPVSCKVAFAATVMFLALPRIIRDFRDRFPLVHLDLREMPTGPQLGALVSGEIDIGFVREPTPDDTLEIVTVMREPLRIAVNKSHPLAARPTLAVRDLASEPFVLFPEELAPGLYRAGDGALPAGGVHSERDRREPRALHQREPGRGGDRRLHPAGVGGEARLAWGTLPSHPVGCRRDEDCGRVAKGPGPPGGRGLHAGGGGRRGRLKQARCRLLAVLVDLVDADQHLTSPAGSRCRRAEYAGHVELVDDACRAAIPNRKPALQQ